MLSNVTLLVTLFFLFIVDCLLLFIALVLHKFFIAFVLRVCLVMLIFCFFVIKKQR